MPETQYPSYPVPNQQFGQPAAPQMVSPPQPIYALTREDLVLRTFFTDINLSGKMRPSLRPELFQDPSNRNIVSIINKYEHKHSRLPTAQELVTGMGENDYAIQARDKLIFLYNTPIQYMHEDYVVQLVEGFFKERMSEEVLISAAESIHDRRVEGIRDLIPRLHAAVTFSLHTDLGINMYTDADLALQKLREQKQCIPSAINEIRYYTGQRNAEGVALNGGYYRKTLSLFVGQPNVGKSLTLGNEAAFAYKMGYNVLYITLELAEDYVWQRLAANICNVDFFSVMTLTGDEVRKRIDMASASLRETGARPGQLQVKYMKTTTTPVEIEAVIDSFEIAYGKLDLLVVDYIGIMKPARGRVTESSMYNDGVLKAEQIRDLAIERNFAALSAVQFNRSGYHNLEAGIESVEGSSGYAETADFMLSLTSDDILRGANMFNHVIMKSRLGPANISFVTRYDFKTMTWQSATAEEVNSYKIARADADVQVNAPRPGLKGQPKRAMATSAQAPTAEAPAAESAEKPVLDTCSDYV